MLSKSAKYALKGVLYLAMNTNEQKRVMAKDISGPINVPPSYIAKLLQQLGRHGVVSSIKGPHGGFFLTEENKKTPLIKIIDLLDGEYRLKSCMLSLKDCNELNPCPLHRLVGNVKSDFIRSLEQTTIAELVQDIKDGKSFLPL